MKISYVLLVLLPMLSTGCIRSKYEPSDGDVDLFSVEDADSSELMGALEDRDRLVTKIPVTVSSDLAEVVIDIDGDRQQLEKTGSGEKCHCSFYRNDSYAVMVEYAALKPIKARVLRLVAEDEEVRGTGSLADTSGIKVKIPINIVPRQQNLWVNSGSGSPPRL